MNHTEHDKEEEKCEHSLLLSPINIMEFNQVTLNFNQNSATWYDNINIKYFVNYGKTLLTNFQYIES